MILREVMQGDQKKLEALDQKQTKQELKNALTSSSAFESDEASEEKDTESDEIETAEIVSLDRFRKDPAPKS